MIGILEDLALEIEHDIEGHRRPAWECPDCAALLRAQAAAAHHEQGDILGYCHEAGAEHAWYHKHGDTWVRPAEDRGFA